MIGQFYEPFCKLKKICEEDGMGGEDIRLEAAAPFAAGLCRVTEKRVTVGQTQKTLAQGVLVHAIDVALDCGEMIRRERDGAIFRVIGDSDDTRTPPCASVFFAQTKVERLVDAHDDLYAATGAA